jgi:hypothetical protein
MTYLRPRLIARLRGGEVPARDTLPPGLRQRELVDWGWWQMGRGIAITGHDAEGRLLLTGCVYWTDGGLRWVLAENGFYWLGDGAAR